jgi:hypothetical protein
MVLKDNEALVEQDGRVAINVPSLENPPTRIAFTLGRYPAGAVVGVYITTDGGDDYEILINPAWPGALDRLIELSRQDPISVLADGRSYSVKNGRFSQRQIREVAERARRHLEGCMRLDWETAVADHLG